MDFTVLNSPIFCYRVSTPVIEAVDESDLQNVQFFDDDDDDEPILGRC